MTQQPFFTLFLDYFQCLPGTATTTSTTLTTSSTSKSTTSSTTSTTTKPSTTSTSTTPTSSTSTKSTTTTTISSTSSPSSTSLPGKFFMDRHEKLFSSIHSLGNISPEWQTAYTKVIFKSMTYYGCTESPSFELGSSCTSKDVSPRQS